MILTFPLELSNISSHQQLCVVCFPVEEACMVALFFAVVWPKDTNQPHSQQSFI